MYTKTTDKGPYIVPYRFIRCNKIVVGISALRPSIARKAAVSRERERERERERACVSMNRAIDAMEYMFCGILLVDL